MSLILTMLRRMVPGFSGWMDFLGFALAFIRLKHTKCIGRKDRMPQMPEEILLEVASHLRGRDLLAFSIVSDIRLDPESFLYLLHQRQVKGFRGSRSAPSFSGDMPSLLPCFPVSKSHINMLQRNFEMQLFEAKGTDSLSPVHRPLRPPPIAAVSCI